MQIQRSNPLTCHCPVRLRMTATQFKISPKGQQPVKKRKSKNQGSPLTQFNTESRSLCGIPPGGIDPP